MEYVISTRPGCQYANEQLILQLRKERKLEARRIHSELKRLHNISFSTATIHKVLKKHKVDPLFSLPASLPSYSYSV